MLVEKHFWSGRRAQDALRRSPSQTRSVESGCCWKTRWNCRSDCFQGQFCQVLRERGEDQRLPVRTT